MCNQATIYSSVFRSPHSGASGAATQNQNLINFHKAIKMYMIRGSLLPYPSQYYLYMLYTTLQFFCWDLLLCAFGRNSTTHGTQVYQQCDEIASICWDDHEPVGEEAVGGGWLSMGPLSLCSWPLRVSGGWPVGSAESIVRCCAACWAPVARTVACC